MKPLVKEIAQNKSLQSKRIFWRPGMAFGFKASRFAFLRLNLGPKTVLSAALLIAVNTALVVGAGYWSLTREFDARAARAIHVHFGTSSLASAETFPNANIP